MKCVNLTKEILKYISHIHFGIHFSSNKKLEHEMNFESHIVKIESVLMLWPMRNLTIEGKVLVFKSLAVSKIAYLSLIATVPDAIINQFNSVQKKLYV